MSVWKVDGTNKQRIDLRDSARGMDGYLYCPGPSLASVKDADVHVPGAMVFAINTAYPHIRPDVWMGLDTPECYDRTLWDQPFVKCCRGTYQHMTCAGVPVSRFNNVVFMDTKPPPQDEPYKFILERSDDFTWHKNTLMWAIDIMVYLGIRHIHFVGCDMGGDQDYHDGRKLDDQQHNVNRRLYKSQVDSLKVLVPMLGKIGVLCTSCTYVSPLNRFMRYRSLGCALKETSSKSVSFPIRTAEETLASKARICGITPTRGDRPQFVEQCRGMMERQTRHLDAHYIIDRPPTMDGNDQRERVIEAAEQALKDGFSRALVIEDDDYYRNDYVETMLEVWPQHVPMIGSWYYSIYHVGERARITYTSDQLSPKDGIQGSPLHATGFDLEMFLRFAKSRWLNSCPNLDQDLWKWAQDMNIPRKLIEIPRLIISIKHGEGKHAGGCHNSIASRPGAIADPDMEWLRRNTDPAVHGFYANFGRKHELTEIANECGTDKGTVHNDAHGYTEIYGPMFAHLKDKTINMLEIGVSPCPPHHPELRTMDTPSLNMWRRFFPKSSVLGMDIVERDGVFLGDQGNPEDLKRLIAEHPEPFDIIVDDGSHNPQDQVASMYHLWPHLREGGYYCIEDLGLTVFGEQALRFDLNQTKRTKVPFRCQHFNGELKSSKLIHWDGKLAIFKKIPKVVVYSAVMGDIDNGPPRIVGSDDDVTFRFFTDNPDITSDQWDVSYVPKSEKPKRDSTVFKIQPHLFLSEFNYSVWIDGNSRLTVNDFASWVVDQLRGHVFAAVDMRNFTHTHFNNIEEYVAFLVNSDHPRVNDRDVLLKQMERYRKQGDIPSTSLLPAGGFLLRKHNSPECRTIMDVWKREYDAGSERDDIALWKCVKDAPEGAFKFLERKETVPRWSVVPHSRYNQLQKQT